MWFFSDHSKIKKGGSHLHCYVSFSAPRTLNFVSSLILQEGPARERKIIKLCEYAVRNPIRVPKVIVFNLILSSFFMTGHAFLTGIFFFKKKGNLGVTNTCRVFCIDCQVPWTKDLQRIAIRAHQIHYDYHGDIQ